MVARITHGLHEVDHDELLLCRKETGHVGMRPRATSKKFAGKLAFESCGYKECNYLSKYKSNMLRHRRTYGHYLNEDEKEEAEEDHKR